MLLQRAQAAVASGMTGLTQVTDCGFASQAKAALARHQNNLKRTLREKARQEGRAVPVQGRRGGHLAGSQNEKEGTVMRCMRQAGWFHYRPDAQGLLQPVTEETQPWCAGLEEGSDKLPGRYLQDRGKWVQDGSALPFDEEDLKSDQAGEALRVETDYLTSLVTGQAAGMCFEFAAKRSALADSEKQFQELVEQATHPSQRRQKFLRQAGEAQSQIVKQRHKKHGRETFRQRVKKWREEQGSKSAATALKQVVRSVGKKQTAKKQAAKKSKVQKNSKTKASAKQKGSLKDKPSAHRKQQRKAEEKQDKRALAAKATQQAEETAAAEEGIAGRQARVVGERAPQVVLCVMQKGEEVQVRQQGQTYWVRKSDLCFDVRLPQHPARLDYAGLSASVATEAMRAVQDVDFYDWGSLLTDSQVVAGIQEVAARLGKQPDVTVLTPAEVEVVSQERALPEELVLAAKKPGRHMIFCACLHTTGPLHYTLLCMQREADSQWQMRYYDTLPSPSQSAYEKSRQLLKLVLETAKADSQGLPAPCNFYKQKDGFSCGLWVLLYLEKELRQWSGEAAQATKPEPEKVADRLNRWVKFLLTSQAVEQMRQEAAADQPSARKQEAAEPEPPLPPPAAPPGPGEPVEHVWGCSKCRGTKTGCKDCNPAETQPEPALASAKSEPKASAKAKSRGRGKGRGRSK